MAWLCFTVLTSCGESVSMKWGLCLQAPDMQQGQRTARPRGAAVPAATGGALTRRAQGLPHLGGLHSPCHVRLCNRVPCRLSSTTLSTD
jgi:hypothetical protein